jgi:hypothetical protein
MYHLHYHAKWLAASLIEMLKAAAAAPAAAGGMVIAPAAAAAAGGAYISLDDDAMSQIAALLTTCLKAAAGHVDGICGSNLEDALATTGVVALVMEAAAAAAAGHNASQLLVTQGRSLALVGRFMAAICSQEPRAAAQLQQLSMPAACTFLLNQCINGTASMAQGLTEAGVQLPGEAAAAAAALVKLQQEAAAVQQQLQQHLEQLPEQSAAAIQQACGITHSAPTAAAALRSGGSFRAAGGQPAALQQLVFTADLCQAPVELGEAAALG